MELNVQVEKPSSIVRKLTVRVPAKEVSLRFQKGLAEVQKTARLKGFRPGHAPLTMIQQFYGEDIKHRLYHNLIDESFALAAQKENLRTVGSPQIDTPEHKTGPGEHDHTLKEGSDLIYTAVVEILPEFEAKGYQGLALTRVTPKVTDADVEQLITQTLNSRAELVPATSGLADASGKIQSRPAEKGDFVDIHFDGGLVTESGIEKKEGMQGTRVLEIGSGEFIAGFEDELVGLRSGESKTFRVKFPDDYMAADFAGEQAEFAVTVNEVKVKKLPELTDEFVQGVGYADVADFRKKVRDHLVLQKTDESDKKLRSEAVEILLGKNQFEVPNGLVEAQTRALAQDWTKELRKNGLSDEMIQSALHSELDALKKRADQQVRASILLENVASQEKVTVTSEDMDFELSAMAKNMGVPLQNVQEFYTKERSRREDFLFRLRQEKTLKFILDQAKIKSVEA